MYFFEVKDELVVSIVFREYLAVAVGDFAPHTRFADLNFVVGGDEFTELVLAVDLEVVQLSHKHAAAHQHQHGEDIDSVSVAWAWHGLSCRACMLRG